MSEAENKVEWCLKKAERELKESDLHRGLVKVESNIELAEKHVTKAEHNLKASLYFEKGGFSDWSASAFFYTIYHCFLAILVKFGYETRNQECALAAIEMLNEQGKIKIDKKFIDTLKITKIEEMQEDSLIRLRENLQYGVELKFKEQEEFERLTEMCKEIISKTREIIHK